jgi:hypothetical protein
MIARVAMIATLQADQQIRKARDNETHTVAVAQ